jgi:uncharacterized protein (TIGR03067 family)
MLARAVLGSLVFLCLLGADEPSKEAKKELELLQGKWIQVHSEYKGTERIGRPGRDEITLTIKEDQWILYNETRERLECKLTINIDPSKEPKEIDLQSKIDGQERTNHCIYKLKEDTLTICGTNNGNERPKEFKTNSEEGILSVWKRAKK